MIKKANISGRRFSRHVFNIKREVWRECGGAGVAIVAMGLFAYADVFASQSLDVIERGPKLIGPLNFSDAGFLVILTFAVLCCPRWKFLFNSRLLWLVVGLVALASFNGLVVNQVGFVPFRPDLRKPMWFFGGIGFGIAVLESRRPLWGLLLSTCIASVVMLLGSERSAHIVAETAAYLDTARFADNIVFDYAAWLLAPLSLLIVVGSWGRSSARWGGWAVLGCAFVIAAYLSGTRSVMLYLLPVFVGALWGGMHKPSENGLRSPRLGRVVGIALGVSLVAVGAVAFVDPMRLQAFLQRFDPNSTPDVDSALWRWEELVAFCRSLSLRGWLVGWGIGGYFDNREMGKVVMDLHIGLFNLQRVFGIAGLGVGVVIFIVVTPMQIIRSIVAPVRMGERERAAWLAVGPALLGYAVMMLTSGGYSVYCCFGWGVCFIFFNAIRREGLWACEGIGGLTPPSRQFSRPQVSSAGRRVVGGRVMVRSAGESH